MPPIKLNAGQRFGNLTYIEDAPKKVLPSGQKPRRALVVCDCGNKKDTLVLHLIRNRITSCGECFIPSEYRTDEVGNSYGTLTVLASAPDIISKNRRFRCVIAKCVCGNIKSYRLNGLKRITSCGCLTTEILKGINKQHGMAGTRPYSTWLNMRNRCSNSKIDSYPLYGAKGVTVCKEWNESFISFYEWAISNGYEENLTIDRYPNQNGNYEPDNCRWATQKQQMNNVKSNLIIEYMGEKLTLSELCDKYDLIYSRVHARIAYLKWSIEDAVTR